MASSTYTAEVSLPSSLPGLSAIFGLLIKFDKKHKILNFIEKGILN